MAVIQSAGSLLNLRNQTNPMIDTSIRLHDGRSQDYATLWRVQPNVRLVTGFLARNIAQLGLHAFERVSDTERRRLPSDHPLSRLIRQPNPYQSRSSFMNSLVHDLKIYDRYYAMKVANPLTGGMSLFRLPPYTVTPVGGWFSPDRFDVRKPDGSTFKLTPDRMLDLHGYNPADQRSGVSPLESLRQILAEESASGQWREQYWRSASRMSGVIERPVEASKWSETARTRFRSDWQSVYAGGGVGAGSTPVLEEGMTWKAASFSPKDSEYLAARRLSREETAAQYWVSPLFVGILDHANFSNVSEQHKHLYQDTLGPDLTWIQEELERQVIIEFTDLNTDTTYLEFNLAEKLKGTFEEQAGVIQTMTGRPVMTANEGRARLNLPPMDGGDDLVIPLNVLVGGQASATDSAPPPKALTKSAGELPRAVSGWHAKHVEILRKFFARQQSAVMSRLGKGATVSQAWDENRWNDELTTDLFGLASVMTNDVAAPVAVRFGGQYDPTVSLAYLQKSARIAAENVNEATRTAVEQAWTTRKSKAVGDNEDDGDPLAAVLAVFAIAAESRAEQIAVSRVTTIGGFASTEGATQAGVTYKVWQINSANPRADHPGNGETVPIDGVFSNGARWPGDGSAGVDQTAGCTCSLDFTTEAS